MRKGIQFWVSGLRVLPFPLVLSPKILLMYSFVYVDAMESEDAMLFWSEF